MLVVWRCAVLSHSWLDGCVSDSSNAGATLRVECVPLTDEAGQWALLDLLARTSPSQPLVWLRNGDGLVGAGRTLRLAFRGPNRFADAARAWQLFSSTAQIDDRVNLPGSGLVAFGTFAFSDQSEAESVLLIPEFVFGQRDSVAWVSRLVDATELPAALELDGDVTVHFDAGQMSEATFSRAVNTAKARIRGGELGKVVLARDLVAKLPAETDLRLVISHLANLYADCWTFAIDGMLGASPETLLQVSHGSVSGRVLAGTASRNASDVADNKERLGLLNSEKDQAEHEFAVQSVVAGLAPFTHDLSVSEHPFALELPNVWHLATDFSGELNPGSSIIDVVAALHPTAAVAGTPTDIATALIDELEPFDRGRYAGPVGWLDANGNGEWGIALRCAQVSENKVTAYAGGGIVAASIAEDELAETIVKFEPIVHAFGGDE